MSSAAAEPQTALDERVLENTSDLEAALDAREQKKVVKRKVTKEFKDADTVVKGLLEPFGLGEAEVVRVGKYRIEQKTVPGGSRAFETSDSTRLVISTVETQLTVTS